MVTNPHAADNGCRRRLSAGPALLAVLTAVAGACSPGPAQPAPTASGADRTGAAAAAPAPTTPPAPSADGLVALDVTERPLAEVVALIQQKADVNLMVAKEAEDEPVTLRLPRPVPWREALRLVEKQTPRIQVEEESPHVIRIEKPQRVNFEFENADVRVVIKTLADISGANIVIGREVAGTVTCNLKEVPWRKALDSIVEPLGYRVVKDAGGILRIGEPPK